MLNEQIDEVNLRIVWLTDEDIAIIENVVMWHKLDNSSLLISEHSCPRFGNIDFTDFCRKPFDNANQYGKH